MSELQTASEFIADRKAAETEIKKLQQSNIDKVQALAKYGKGIHPADLANIKIDTFIKSFLDGDAQLVYLRNLEVELRNILDEALGQVRQSQIVQGVPEAVKKLYIPK